MNVLKNDNNSNFNIFFTEKRKLKIKIWTCFKGVVVNEDILFWGFVDGIVWEFKKVHNLFFILDKYFLGFEPFNFYFTSAFFISKSLKHWVQIANSSSNALSV